MLAMPLEGPKTYQDRQGGKKHGFSQKVIPPTNGPWDWSPGEFGTTKNDGHIKPVILQCRTPRETNPKGQWGPVGASVFFSTQTHTPTHLEVTIMTTPSITSQHGSRDPFQRTLPMEYCRGRARGVQ